MIEPCCWAVIIAAGDYAIRKIEVGELLPPDAIAFHPGQRSAELALERVLAFHLAVQGNMRESLARESKLRGDILALPNAARHPDLIGKPVGQSLSFEAAFRNRNLASLIEIAQPRLVVTGSDQSPPGAGPRR